MYHNMEEQDLALNLGYEITTNHDSGSRFVSVNGKGIRHVWPVKDGWQTANISEETFTNHCKYDTLGDALRRSL